MKLYRIIFFLVISIEIHAQAVVYEYDPAGNRKARYQKVVAMLVAAPTDPALALSKQPSDLGSVAKTAAIDLDKVNVEVVEITATVFPNPSTGKFQINLNAPVSDAIFELFDATGRLIWSQTAQSYTIPIDITKQASGNYILLLKREKEYIKTWKLVKS